MSTPTNLSPHFTLDELCRSQVATRLGIPNRPHVNLIGNLQRLCALVLEPLRASAGAIQISSGYRSRELNTAIGGSATSQHCQGLAADLLCAGLSPLALCQRILALQLPFDQLIFEGTWTHVSVAPVGQTPRGQVLTAHFKRGRASYTVGLP